MIGLFICWLSVQERGGASAEFAHENLMLKFKMDNEFELVYVVRGSREISFMGQSIGDYVCHCCPPRHFYTCMHAMHIHLLTHTHMHYVFSLSLSISILTRLFRLYTRRLSSCLTSTSCWSKLAWPSEIDTRTRLSMALFVWSTLQTNLMWVQCWVWQYKKFLWREWTSLIIKVYGGY